MTRFERFAGACALLVAGAGLLYSLAFVWSRTDSGSAETASWIFLMLGGLLTVPVFVAVYGRLREVEPGFALLALLLGVMGAFGSIIHGAYEVAVAVELPPGGKIFDPSTTDPRGVLTFGVAGLALFVVAWLVTQGGPFPRRLGYLAFVAAGLLVAVYLARLFIDDVGNPLLLVLAAALGFVVNPALYIWLGLVLTGRHVRR